MKSRRHLAAALSALLLFAAALPVAQADAPSADIGVRKASPRARAMTVAPQKPNGSGVVVRYRIEGTPQPGQAVPVALTLERITASDASVRFQADAGLALRAGAEARALEVGRATALTVEVVPGNEGTGYLHVFTTQNGVTSATSIPVTVGKGGASASAVGELKPSADGEKILTLPVK